MKSVIEFPDTWVGTGEAARVLGVHAPRVHLLIQAGRLPAIKTTLGYLIDAKEIEALRVELEAGSQRKSGEED